MLRFLYHATVCVTYRATSSALKYPSEVVLASMGLPVDSMIRRANSGTNSALEELGQNLVALNLRSGGPVLI